MNQIKYFSNPRLSYKNTEEQRVAAFVANMMCNYNYWQVSVSFPHGTIGIHSGEKTQWEWEKSRLHVFFLLVHVFSQLPKVLIRLLLSNEVYPYMYLCLCSLFMVVTLPTGDITVLAPMRHLYHYLMAVARWFASFATTANQIWQRKAHTVLVKKHEKKLG